jgi:hypothetical protein
MGLFSKMGGVALLAGALLGFTLIEGELFKVTDCRPVGGGVTQCLVYKKGVPNPVAQVVWGENRYYPVEVDIQINNPLRNIARFNLNYAVVETDDCGKKRVYGVDEAVLALVRCNFLHHY